MKTFASLVNAITDNGLFHSTPAHTSIRCCIRSFTFCAFV